MVLETLEKQKHQKNLKKGVAYISTEDIVNPKKNHNRRNKEERIKIMEENGKTTRNNK